MDRRHLICALIVSTLIAAALAAAFFLLVDSTQGTAGPPETDYLNMEVRDEPHTFVFNYQKDMQYPELPTGCEATAVSTLLRMHGYNASKTEVADAMPKSDWDFVDCFWGDPYKETGGACMSPCAAATANMFIEDGAEAVAVRSTLGELDLEGALPACVWVTINLEEPRATRTLNGYTCYTPSHCVVVRKIENGTVYCYDPLSGVVDYPLQLFEKRYEQLGSQAVYINHDAKGDG